MFNIRKGNYSLELKELIINRLVEVIQDGTPSQALEAMEMLSEMRNELSIGYEFE